jgi:carboxylesterase
MTPTLFRNPQLDGAALNWAGNTTGILLIHGFTATTTTVRPLAESLRDRGYTVVAPLLPGHGTTPADLRRCRWQDWAGAVETAYAQLAVRCDRVFAGGESMGAVLALHLASHHPELAGVLAFAPALRLPPGHMPVARLVSLFRAYIPKSFGPPSAADGRWKGYTVNPVQSVVQLGQLQTETLRRLHLIHQPLLIVQGRLDRTIDPRCGEILLRQTASTHKELHWLEHSTHCVLIDSEWQQTTALALNFVETTPGNE